MSTTKNLVTLTRLVRRHTRTIKELGIRSQDLKKISPNDVLLTSFMHEHNKELHAFILQHFRKEYEQVGYQHFKGQDLDMQRYFLELCLKWTDPYRPFVCLDSMTANIEQLPKFEKAFMSNVSN